MYVHKQHIWTGLLQLVFFFKFGSPKIISWHSQVNLQLFDITPDAILRKIITYVAALMEQFYVHSMVDSDLCGRGTLGSDKYTYQQNTLYITFIIIQFNIKSPAFGRPGLFGATVRHSATLATNTEQGICTYLI
jgi:hypothetical protein